MSATPEPEQLGPPTTLYEHALRLHRAHPDGPLPRNGEPYPGDRRRLWQDDPEWSTDERRKGARAAAILDAHFARASARPADLVDAFHHVHVPSRPNDHISAVARRVDHQRVRQTGRWLVRHAANPDAASIGLALLASVWEDDDIPLIQTIGLLSRGFAPLAVHALERRPGSTEALLWLAERVTGWGRVYVVDSLCARSGTFARDWLLRRACDGDFLNRYFAGKVATVAHLHEAITRVDTDSELVDHTGRLLATMAESDGMGLTLAHYPPARVVLEAHLGHARPLAATVERYFVNARLADYLDRAGEELTWPPGDRERIRDGYLSLLDRDDWSEVARAGLAADNFGMSWLAGEVALRLGLRALVPPGPAPGHAPEV
ncbi:hypothetical protein BDK92_4355 [Micromonospora pisi]|uniref:Uncharacterized protein n=1 Tax=Micromonospora pisi TaxID=589240 RepID=A0A495JMD1_9ACTN|nr:hypothetical protein [Micromonospora pisi]RKR89991.1 hypothetical protein BDK92_4355 [Micromonospora pisi]